MLVDSDDTLNRGWDMDRDINIVLLYIDLRDDVGSLRSDPGVSPDRGEYLCLDNSVSRSKTSRDRCWRDGSIRCWWSGDHWSGQSNSLNMVLGNTSSIRDSWLSNVLNTTNRVSMTTDNRLDSSLDNLMSNNSILNTALNLGGSSNIGSSTKAKTSIAKTSMGNSSKSKTGMGNSSSIAERGNHTSGGVGGGTHGTGHNGESDYKAVHVSIAPVQKRLPC